MSTPAPNHTQTPNLLFDEWMPELRESELKVLLIVIRQTFGWHKEADELSLSQLMAKTGLSRQGVIDGIERGIERGNLTREPSGQSFRYKLVVNELDQSTDQTGSSQQSRPEVVNKVDTQNKGKENKETPNGNGRKRDLVYEAVYTGLTGEPYVSGQSKQLGLANRIRKDLRQIDATPEAVTEYYAALRIKGLSPTTDSAKVQAGVLAIMQGNGNGHSGKPSKAPVNMLENWEE